MHAWNHAPFKVPGELWWWLAAVQARLLLKGTPGLHCQLIHWLLDFGMTGCWKSRFVASAAVLKQPQPQGAR